MDVTELLINTLIALLLGTAVGIKNEQEIIRREEEIGKAQTGGMIGGFRTHAMLALFGVISGIFYVTGNPLLTGLITGIVLALILVYYASGVFVVKAYGITDEMSAIFAHLIGLLLITQPVSIKFIIAISVVVIFIITRKDAIRGLRNHINQKEVYDFSLFAIIALVILPFLPNKSITINDLDFLIPFLDGLAIPKLDQLREIEIINPFTTWFIVVFVSGLDLLGHVLSKFISKGNSEFLSAAIGGFVSSTSTTIVVSIRSKTKDAKNRIDNLVAAALASNAVSLIQTLILVSFISGVFFKRIFVTSIIIFIGGFILALLINHRANQSRRKNSLNTGEVLDYTRAESDDATFRLEPALRFAVILTAVKLFSQVALIYLGNLGFIFTSMFAAMTGIDAVVINLGELTNVGSITLQLAFYTFMAVNFVNFVSKIFYAYLSGDKKFATKFAIYIMLLFVVAFSVGIFW